LLKFTAVNYVARIIGGRMREGERD